MGFFASHLAFRAVLRRYPTLLALVWHILKYTVVFNRT